MSDFLLALLPVWLLGLWAVLIAVLITGGFRQNPVRFLRACWADLLAVLADEPPCPRCGKPSKVLGRRAGEAWRYCEPCGHTWPESATTKAVA